MDSSAEIQDGVPIDDAGSSSDSESNADLQLPDVSESNSDHEATKAQDLIRLKAASEGDKEALQCALNEGASLTAEDDNGQTSLHLAILHDHEPVGCFLLKLGDNIEARTKRGSRPLYMAVDNGNLSLVDLLLQFRADVESRNTVKKTTALYEAVYRAHLEVAELLLAHGAYIDAKGLDGYTALFNAVLQENLQLVEMLLQHGANKKVSLPDGRTMEDLATGIKELRDTLLALLQDDLVLQDPSIGGHEPTASVPYSYIRPPPVDKSHKLHACNGFKCTIVDFFLGDYEQRIQVSPTVYEVLYGKGLNEIMDLARVAKMSETNRAFRWYHFPANNIDWVEELVTRIFAERRTGSPKFDEEFKSNLALTSAIDRHFRASTAYSSFMRPLCQTVKVKLEIF